MALTRRPHRVPGLKGACSLGRIPSSRRPRILCVKLFLGPRYATSEKVPIEGAGGFWEKNLTGSVASPASPTGLNSSTYLQAVCVPCR